MSWPLYLALKQLFPTGRRVPFFTVVCLTGVAIGVMVLIVCLSVMGGFGFEIRRMVVDTAGEIQIKSSGSISDPAALRTLALRQPGVTGATAYADGVVMLLMGNRPAFPSIKGIDLNHVEEVLPLSNYLRAGRLDDLDDDSIILNQQLAESLGARLGSKVELYTPLMLEKLRKDEVLLPREFTVVGIFEIGHRQLDSNSVYCTLRTMQDLYGLGRSVQGLNLRLKPGADEGRIVDALNASLPPNVRAVTWEESYRDFLFVLRLEKYMFFMLLMTIVIVAGFAVAVGLFVAVVRKTREIGLLAALGGDARGVATCFCYQGLIIGIAGTAVGTVIGFTIVHYRNDLVHGFARLTNSRDALVNAYEFYDLPAHLAGTDLAIILVSAVVISTVAALLPAWRAARLKPAEALRSE